MKFDGTACKSLRAQIAMTQSELARVANVSQKTISDFEKGKTTPQQKTLDSILLVGENAGMTLSTSPANLKAGAGTRWVTAGDFEQWVATNSRKLQGLLPEIIRRLVKATVPDADIGFAVGDSICMSGWDGKVESSKSTQYVPHNLSGWEMGCGKSVTVKANKDYEKRKDDPLSFDPSEITFVFVSPRRWKGKASWIATHRKENFWADVKGLDADDLEHWLMEAPDVAIWLAKEMGKYTAGVESIDEYWKRWKLQTDPNLTASIILAGRRGIRDTKLLEWLDSPGGVLAVQGETDDETIAFLAASLETLPSDPHQSQFRRCLIVSDKEAYRCLTGESTSMILVISEEDCDLAGAAAKLGHHVFIPLGKESRIPLKNGLQLPSLDRNEFVSALKEIGYDDDKANDLSKETGRSIPALKRQLGTTRNPKWAKPESAKYLIPAILAGGWDGNNENDKKILEDLGDSSYADLDQSFTQWAKESDSPLKHIGHLWRHTSRLDSWILLSPHITASHIERLTKVVTTVFEKKDPKFDVQLEDRWCVTETVIHSEALREGLLQTLILLATKSNESDFPETQEPERWVENQIDLLLHDATEERWYSLSTLLPLFSEAAPNAFLESVKNSLSQTKPTIMTLFKAGESVFGGDGSDHCYLLCALENLGCDQKYLTRVTHILGILVEIDPNPDSNIINRPARSLKEIVLLWLKNTHATLDQGLEAIDYLIKHNPDSAWKLMLSILLNGQDILCMTHKMRWRQLTPPNNPPTPEQINAIYFSSNILIYKLFSLVGLDIPRWCDLFKKYTDLSYEMQQEMIANFSKSINGDTSPEDKKTLANVFRNIISYHRQFPEAEWSMDEKSIQLLESQYRMLIPEDPIEKNCWLFDDPWPALTDGTKRNEDKVINNLRVKAVDEINERRGVDGLIELSKKCKEPGIIGKIAAICLPASKQDWDLFQHWNNATHPLTLAGRSFVSTRMQVLGNKWVKSAIQHFSEKSNEATLILKLFLDLPFNINTWKLLEEQSLEIQNKYWKEVFPYSRGESTEDMIYSIKKLLMAKRANIVLCACRFDLKKIPSQLLVKLLEQLPKNLSDKELKPDGHDIDEAFEILDAATDISENEITKLEWQYAGYLNRYGVGRGTKALHKEMAKNPHVFVDMLKFKYKHENKIQDEKEKKGRTEESIKMCAKNAYKVLNGMKIIPGSDANGNINLDELKKWLKNTRELAGDVGRLAGCDFTIGHIFAFSGEENENIWPAFTVCEVIEEIRSSDLEQGFSIGVHNKRGVIKRAYNEGGKQEYKLATQFTGYAQAIESKYPRVATVLHNLASDYKGNGRTVDIAATARDLEY